ncbi:AaceriAFR525Cp [[Ashbya] aceris (nom. inval.)]|nr:AaceriAFR525Cp [[Ashbya] aceris (nom. inval.)]
MAGQDSAETFSIAGQALKLTSRADMEAQLGGLAEREVVRKIDLSGNTLGAEASAALAEAIQEHACVREHLEEVNFADLYTSRLVEEVVESLQVLLPALLACPRLAVVNLSDNAFGLRTIEALENYIAHAVGLRELLLANNGMGPFAGERIGRALYALAVRKREAGQPPLEVFVCGRNRLENGSARCLALGLKSHGDGLRTVRLYQNGIRPSGIATLIRHGLRHNHKLEVLDLQDNTLTQGASEVLADALPVWKDTLRELNVNDCLLKAGGCESVLRALGAHNFAVLDTLKLQYNEMSQAALENILLPALEGENLSALRSLELNGNRLEEDSDALQTLQEVFKGELDELDDLEEPDSDAEESDESEEETLDEFDVEELEKSLGAFQVDELAEKIAGTHL